MHYIITRLGRITALLTFVLLSQQTIASTCLYVSSYHKGYEWSDGIEDGINKVLRNKCKMVTFYMDTKRNKSREFGVKAGRNAQVLIKELKPDIVIACDDNASRYLVKPYYKNKKLPVVFCGVNHNADEYGYPYSNVTGIIEIAPVKPLIKLVLDTLNTPKKGVYLGVDVISQHKEYVLNAKHYNKVGIRLEKTLVKTMAQWESAYRAAQKNADFIILGSNGGMADWNLYRAKQIVNENTNTLTVTNMSWLSKLAMVSITKDANEQGEWAAKVALEILAGTRPGDIPVVANRKWKIFINKTLVEKSKLKLPKQILSNALDSGTLSFVP